MSKQGKKLLKAPAFKVESVKTGEKSIEVMLTGVRMIYDAISEVSESEFEGTKSYRFCAGLEIPETKEVRALVNTIRKHFSDLVMNGWAGKVAVQHFDEKKFQPGSNDGMLLLYPSSPAKPVDENDPSAGFQASGKLFVNPNHEAFYAGCFVDVKIAFVANIRGKMTVKDYLNGIKFNTDGEPISGAVDPWGDSESKAVVSGVKRSQAEEEKPAAKKKGRK